MLTELEFARRATRSDFVLPTWVIAHFYKLSALEHRVLAVILHTAWERGSRTPYLQLRAIALKAGLATSSVQRAVTRLVRLGILGYEAGERGKASCFTLYEMPLGFLDKSEDFIGPAMELVERERYIYLASLEGDDYEPEGDNVEHGGGDVWEGGAIEGHKKDTNIPTTVSTSIYTHLLRVFTSVPVWHVFETPLGKTPYGSAVFGTDAFGPVGGRIYASLTETPIKQYELAILVDVSPRTIKRHLPGLVEIGLADRVRGGYARGSIAPEKVANLLEIKSERGQRLELQWSGWALGIPPLAAKYVRHLEENSAITRPDAPQRRFSDAPIPSDPLNMEGPQNAADAISGGSGGKERTGALTAAM